MPFFRPARPASVAWNLSKTLIGILLAWSVFLLLLPLGISIVEVALGIQRFPPQTFAAAALLLASTVVALWAAINVATTGGGTPLPFDMARKIVVTGPYAYLRYPLASAGAGQLVAMGLALGSVPVLLYATLALVVWYYLMRPAAERHLAARFGDAWRDYARAVRGFRPRLTPYRANPEH